MHLPLLGMRLKKQFGQHFLKSSATSLKIFNALECWGQAYHHLVEIGPGGGILTQHLVDGLVENRKLTLVEIDRDLIPALEHNYGPHGVEVKQINFLKLDLSLLSPPFGVIGNFPYNISSQILFSVLEHRSHIPEVVGMFQKEVALRVAAGHGSKTYGILSVLVQAYYSVEVVFTLGPQEFTPPPKVDSAVIRLKRERDHLEGVNEKAFVQMVKAAFNQRRKMLRNSLSNYLGEMTWEDGDDSILQRRPEQLSVDDFIELSKRIFG